MKHLHILTPTALLLLYLPQLSLSLCTIHSRTCPIPLVLLQPLQQENVTEIVPFHSVRLWSLHPSPMMWSAKKGATLTNGSEKALRE